MSKYIQVGSAAMRDPISGEFLESVPLYIRAEDQKKVEAPLFDGEIMRNLAEKFKAYKMADREAKKNKIKSAAG